MAISALFKFIKSISTFKIFQCSNDRMTCLTSVIWLHIITNTWNLVSQYYFWYKSTHSLASWDLPENITLQHLMQHQNMPYGWLWKRCWMQLYETHNHFQKCSWNHFHQSSQNHTLSWCVLVITHPLRHLIWNYKDILVLALVISDQVPEWAEVAFCMHIEAVCLPCLHSS